MDSPDLPRQFVIRERRHRIHDPMSEEKLAVLGRALRLRPDDRVLDLACGSGEMLCTWARDHAITGTGIDISRVFVDDAVNRARELGVEDRVDFVHADASGYVGEPAYDVACCLGASWIGGGTEGTLTLLLTADLPAWVRDMEREARSAPLTGTSQPSGRTPSRG